MRQLINETIERRQYSIKSSDSLPIVTRMSAGVNRSILRSPMSFHAGFSAGILGTVAGRDLSCYWLEIFSSAEKLMHRFNFIFNFGKKRLFICCSYLELSRNGKFGGFG